MNNINWEKVLVSAGMAVSGYFAVLQQLTTFPHLPSFLNGWPLAILGGLSVYGAFMLWQKY